MQEKSQAATTIQAGYRGSRDRKKVNDMKKEKDESQKEESDDKVENGVLMGNTKLNNV